MNKRANVQTQNAQANLKCGMCPQTLQASRAVGRAPTAPPTRALAGRATHQAWGRRTCRRWTATPSASAAKVRAFFVPVGWDSEWDGVGWGQVRFGQDWFDGVGSVWLHAHTAKSQPSFPPLCSRHALYSSAQPSCAGICAACGGVFRLLMQSRSRPLWKLAARSRRAIASRRSEAANRGRRSACDIIASFASKPSSG